MKNWLVGLFLIGLNFSTPVFALSVDAYCLNMKEFSAIVYEYRDRLPKQEAIRITEQYVHSEKLDEDVLGNFLMLIDVVYETDKSKEEITNEIYLSCVKFYNKSNDM